MNAWYLTAMLTCVAFSSWGARSEAERTTVTVMGGPASPTNKQRHRQAKKTMKTTTNSRLCMVYSRICTDLSTGKCATTGEFAACNRSWSVIFTALLARNQVPVHFYAILFLYVVTPSRRYAVLQRRCITPSPWPRFHRHWICKMLRIKRLPTCITFVILNTRSSLKRLFPH